MPFLKEPLDHVIGIFKTDGHKYGFKLKPLKKKKRLANDFSAHAGVCANKETEAAMVWGVKAPVAKPGGTNPIPGLYGPRRELTAADCPLTSTHRAVKCAPSSPK